MFWTPRAAGALFIAIFLVLSGVMPALAQTPGEGELKALSERAEALFQAGRYAKALGAAEEWVKAAEKADSIRKPGSSTATALRTVAWYALFAKRPERALAASERALAPQPGTLWIETNRAHALLFLGRTGEAIAAYTGHKGETIPGNGKWEEVILQDFAEF